MQQTQQMSLLQQRRLNSQQQKNQVQNQQQQQPQQQNKKKPVQKYEYYALGDAVPTYEELETQYQDDPERLCNDHEQLIEQILEEEEQLINGHRKHIDDLVDLVKGEMSLLNDVDKPGSDVSQYVDNLDKLILKKIDMMHQVRQQLIDFHTHLKTEESMAKLYEQQQNMNNNGQDMMDDDQGQIKLSSLKKKWSPEVRAQGCLRQKHSRNVMSQRN